MVHLWLTCVVLLGYFPCKGVLLIQISMTPYKMGDGLLAASKRSNYTFIMLYLCQEMDVNYLIVEEIDQYIKII
jgi:hypothetical protein